MRIPARHIHTLLLLGWLLFLPACSISPAASPHSPDPSSSTEASALPTPSPALTTTAMQIMATPRVILQRLHLSFLDQDGHSLIGSGCPGTDGAGSVIDYHFLVSGVNPDKGVQRILVAGDNSTLTWMWPCTDSWALAAQETGPGQWDVFIAPSSPSEVYTVAFFYQDNSMALGMVRTSGLP